MGEDTKIEWADHTFNPWWGCTRVSEGCQMCYAETFAKRTGHLVWGKNAERRFFGAKHWHDPVKWNAAALVAHTPAYVFCASMADVFEVLPDDTNPTVVAKMAAERQRLWRLIEDTRWLTWLLLTKRPENIRLLTPWGTDWPPNVWPGVSAENQDRADERIPWLLGIEGPYRRFVSYEPAIGGVDFRPYVTGKWCEHTSASGTGAPDVWRCDGCGAVHTWRSSSLVTGVQTRVEITPGRGLDWIICGGESGPGHRPFDPQWARHVRDHCRGTDTAFFFKQHGGRTPKAGGRLLDGEVWDERPQPMEVLS